MLRPTRIMPETRAMRSKQASKHWSTILEGLRDGDECGDELRAMKPNANVATFLIFGSIVFMDTVWDIKMNWPHFFGLTLSIAADPFLYSCSQTYAHVRKHARTPYTFPHTLPHLIGSYAK